MAGHAYVIKCNLQSMRDINCLEGGIRMLQQCRSCFGGTIDCVGANILFMQNNTYNFQKDIGMVVSNNLVKKYILIFENAKIYQNKYEKNIIDIENMVDFLLLRISELNHTFIFNAKIYIQKLYQKILQMYLDAKKW